MNKDHNFVSAIIYCRNNEAEVENMINRVYRQFRDKFKDFEIICVNDDSEDGTAKKIEDVGNQLESVVITTINMSYYQGVENAMRAGIDLAIGDFAYEFDSCIFDYEDSKIIDVYSKCLEGYDIVSLVPNKQKFSSFVFYKIFNKYSNINQAITSERFRILSRRAINRINDLNTIIPYRKALYAQSGLNTAKIEYQQNVVLQVGNKDVAVTSLLLFTKLGSVISISLCLLMTFASLMLTIYTVVVFFTENPIAGWTTTMLFLSISFSLLFLLVSILIKYISVVVELLLKKQEYVIRGIVKNK